MLTLDVVTPEKRILTEDNVSIVTLRTVEGEVGILPNHIPLYSQLAEGELHYVQDGQDYFLAIHGGFLEMANNVVTVLADGAVRAEDIDEAAVEDARQRASDAMAQKVTDEDFAIAEGNLRRAMLQLKIAQKKRLH